MSENVTATPTPTRPELRDAIESALRDAEARTANRAASLARAEYFEHLVAHDTNTPFDKQSRNTVRNNGFHEGARFASERIEAAIRAIAARGEEQNKDVRRPEQLPEAGSSGGCPVVPLAPPASPTTALVEQAREWWAKNEIWKNRTIFENYADFAAQHAATLQAENERLRAEIAEWHDEVARFNRGWERRQPEPGGRQE